MNKQTAGRQVYRRYRREQRNDVDRIIPEAYFLAHLVERQNEKNNYRRIQNIFASLRLSTSFTREPYRKKQKRRGPPPPPEHAVAKPYVNARAGKLQLKFYDVCIFFSSILILLGAPDNCAYF